MAAEIQSSRFRRVSERVGRQFVTGVEDFGYAAALLVESLFWVFFGRWWQQPVRLQSMVKEMMEIGVLAIPVLAILAFANGAMMAMQGIYSGSAIAARIGTMQMAQEIDALRVMGVAPVRYLVSPILVAMLVMLPAMAILSDLMAILGGGVITMLELNIGLGSYFERVLSVLEPADVWQGLSKSVVFGVLITLVATANGFNARGGAEGLGRATTRSVVLCISAIVVADMIFTFFLIL